MLVYLEFYEEEEPEEEKEPEFVIDDQISPDVNQAVILEVLRIRHRGLLDKLMTRGNSWKTKPKFYFIADMDGLAFVSKDIEGHRKESQVLFNTWDTMFEENKIVRDAEEEQEFSTIKLTIVERKTSGLIFKRTNDVEKDTFTVTYDYRTGRWSGDDNFDDRDGYGHYLGDTFEIWFNIYQTDGDYDYIPYWTEVNVLGTDPLRDDSNRDPDGDGIPTAWEWKWGYDPHTWDDHEKLDPDIDGLENIEEYQTERWLANPYVQNIYYEFDHMGRGGFFDPPHTIWEECLQALTEKFAEHNIQLFFDNGWSDTPRFGGGEELPHYEQLSQDSGMMLRFYNHHFPDERKGIFRYVVIGHAGNFNHPSVGNVYDCLHFGNRVEPWILIKHWITAGVPPTARATRLKTASLLMHEMGHSLGLHSWFFEGIDQLFAGGGKAKEKEFIDTWGQYVSVMNYYHMYKLGVLDYSDGSNGPPYDQNDWEQIFLPTFQYNSELVEEIYFEPPGYEKIVYAETEIGVTGYKIDEDLTEKFNESMNGYSPVDPIKTRWAVFKLKDKEECPDYPEIKILGQPQVDATGWALVYEGEIDSNGEIKFYSQQEIIDNIMEQLS